MMVSLVPIRVAIGVGGAIYRLHVPIRTPLPISILIGL